MGCFTAVPLALDHERIPFMTPNREMTASGSLTTCGPEISPGARAIFSSDACANFTCPNLGGSLLRFAQPLRGLRVHPRVSHGSRVDTVFHPCDGTL
jgi:hypothetical protein